MKKFKEFRTEQKYIAEIGPIAATIGAVVGGIALYKGGKDLWKKFTGWLESQKEKKANKKAFVVNVKRFNDETGEYEDHKEVIRGKKLNNDEVEKFKKKYQKDADIKNSSLEADFLDSGGPERVAQQKADKDAADKAAADAAAAAGADGEPETGDGEPETGDGEPETGDGEPEEPEPETDDDEPEPEKEPEKEPDVSTKPEDHIHKYKSADDIPAGVDANAVKKIEGDTLQGDAKKAEAYMKRWDLQEPPKGFKYHVDPGTHKKSDRIVPVEKDKDQGKRRRTKTTFGAGGKKTVQKSSYLRTFGEFITEDIMSDLKKVTKSKSDSEISLDDGNDIPIDPLTAEILVKYIEGLGSSEKNKTIKQIQRTERAFMKVLGKAHGE